MRRTHRLMVLCTLAGVVVPPVTRAEGMRAVAVDGQVEVLRSEDSEWKPLVPGAEVGVLDQVRTGSEAGSRARFLFTDGTVVVAAATSWLRLDNATFAVDGPRVLLRLLGGTLRAVVGESFGAQGRFEIETPTAVAAVHGTEFIVGYDPDEAYTDVIAVEGRVEVVGVLGVLGKPAVLQSGMQTTVRRGAFPDEPWVVRPALLAEKRQETEFTASSRDVLLASYDGLQAGAAKRAAVQAEGGRVECTKAGARMRRGRMHLGSREAEVIDQPISEYALTPPGQVPPGKVTVIFSGDR